LQVILSIIIGWVLCAILTVTDAIPSDEQHWSYYARTDVKIQVLSDANWFRFPYPCRSTTFGDHCYIVLGIKASKSTAYYKQLSFSLINTL